VVTWETVGVFGPALFMIGGGVVYAVWDWRHRRK